MARKHSSTEAARRARAEEAGTDRRWFDEPGRMGLERLRETGALDGRSPLEILENVEAVRTKAVSPFKPWFPDEDEDEDED